MISLKLKIIASSLDSTMSTNLTDIANDYESVVKIIANNKEADAKSLINVMALAITNGTIIDVVAIGVDAIQAIAEIKDYLLGNKIAEIVE